MLLEVQQGRMGRFMHNGVHAGSTQQAGPLPASWTNVPVGTMSASKEVDEFRRWGKLSSRFTVRSTPGGCKAAYITSLKQAFTTFTMLNSLQMDAGMRAILHPFSLANSLVKYIMNHLGVDPDLVSHAINALMQELQAVSTVQDNIIADVLQVLEDDSQLTAAKQVRYTNTGPLPMVLASASVLEVLILADTKKKRST